MSLYERLSGHRKEVYIQNYYNQKVYPEEEKLRKVNRRFEIIGNTIGNMVSINMADKMLQEERERLYLRMLFVGIVVTFYIMLV
jgi:hypothetical protein